MSASRIARIPSWNAIVNTATNHTAAKTGNYTVANQIGNQLKVGDKQTTATTQKEIQEVSKYEVTIGASVGFGIPDTPIGVQAGFATTASLERGTKDCVFIGANVSKSLGEYPKFADYFLPFSLAFDFDIRRTGGEPYITPGGSFGFGVDTFLGANTLSTDVGVSYGGNYYWVWDRK